MRTGILLAIVVLALGGLLWLRAGAREPRCSLPGPACEPTAAAPTEPAIAEAPTAVERVAVEAAGADPQDARPPVEHEPEAARRRARQAAEAAAILLRESPPERWVVGRLLQADGSPARGGVLERVSYDGSLRHAGEGRVDLGTYGDFRVPVEPAHLGLRLVARSNDHVTLDRWVELDAEPGEQDVGIVVLATGGSIAGEVRLGELDPRGWSVCVMTAQPELPVLVPRTSARSAFLDDLGRFELENLPAGAAELSLHHPLLGSVLEREVLVTDGAVTRVELSPDVADPARLLVVKVNAPRGPEDDEIWVEEGGARRAPDSIAGARVVFDDLLPDVPYTLVLALEDEPEATRRTGVLAGTRTEISAASVESQTLAEAKRLARPEDQVLDEAQRRYLEEAQKAAERRRAAGAASDGRR